LAKHLLQLLIENNLVKSLAILDYKDNPKNIRDVINNLNAITKYCRIMSDNTSCLTLKNIQSLQDDGIPLLNSCIEFNTHKLELTKDIPPITINAAENANIHIENLRTLLSTIKESNQKSQQDKYPVENESVKNEEQALQEALKQVAKNQAFRPGNLKRD
jgi:hypothetical protein